ncbi:unnamed protein product, partial [Rotaria sp. Silwood1]
MTVRIVSYNILVPIYGNCPDHYYKCRPEFLQTDYRWNLIQSHLEHEIVHHENTIICLQELSLTLLPKLELFFRRLNYTFFHNLYGPRREDYMGVGIAIPVSMQLNSISYIKIGDHIRSISGGASVFNPSTNFWSTASPPQGNNYVVPRGLIVNNGALPHIVNWSKPTTGLVHAFHSGYWDSWMFEIASINSTQNTTIFSREDFQEVRGSGNGGAFYVANIFEELDLSNEWFLDKDIRTLYFMPNESMPQIFLASQIPCLICISGNSIQDSIHNVLIQGLTLTQTSNTYMRDYMGPSGGDWAVHRGGNIYLTNTRNITLTRYLFMEPGSNGVALIDYNDATSITLNEFVWLADSAIILVGSTNGIDGFSV